MRHAELFILPYENSFYCLAGLHLVNSRLVLVDLRSKEKGHVSSLGAHSVAAKQHNQLEDERHLLNTM